MNADRRSVATEPLRPLPAWLTSPRSRPALHVPIWTKLLRALHGSSKRQAARPIPWHHGITGNAQGIEPPADDGPKPNNG
jgi:hypothetical protein